MMYFDQNESSQNIDITIIVTMYGEPMQETVIDVEMSGCVYQLCLFLFSIMLLLLVCSGVETIISMESCDRLIQITRSFVNSIS